MEPLFGMIHRDEREEVVPDHIAMLMVRTPIPFEWFSVG
jgi:hypothetical protein